jgi:hypothetical protein
MPFIPDLDDPWNEMLAFALSPISWIWSIPMAAGERVSGEEMVDEGRSVRNSMIWLSFAATAWSYNQFMHPGKYMEWRTGLSGFKLMGEAVVTSSWFVPAVVVGSLAATPIAMIANRGDPNQGRQLQSAGSGQPSIGSGGSWLLG